MVTDAYRTVINDSRVTLQIVASLTIVIYDRNIFIEQATGNWEWKTALKNMSLSVTTLSWLNNIRLAYT